MHNHPANHDCVNVIDKRDGHYIAFCPEATDSYLMADPTDADDED